MFVHASTALPWIYGRAVFFANHSTMVIRYRTGSLRTLELV